MAYSLAVKRCASEGFPHLDGDCTVAIASRREQRQRSARNSRLGRSEAVGARRESSGELHAGRLDDQAVDGEDGLDPGHAGARHRLPPASCPVSSRGCHTLSRGCTRSSPSAMRAHRLHRIGGTNHRGGCRSWFRDRGVVAAIAETAHWSHASAQRAICIGSQTEEVSMLWALVVILVVLWLAGFLVVHVGGGLIHLLLVVAAIVLIYQLVTGRRAL